MRALVVEAYGPWDTSKILEIDEPRAGPDEVVVKVEAAGVNFPDILMMEGKYQFKPTTPFVPGVEGAGVVTSVGEAVEDWKEGDRAIFLVDAGAFAEYVAVPRTRLLPLNAGLSFVQGAGLAMIYGTSFHALKQRADIQHGETLLVLGASGGVGTAAVQLGKAMGATVIACASSDQKLAYATSHGADFTINYAFEDIRARIKDLTNGAGPDVVYDPVGGDLAELVFRSIGWGGRYLVVGFAAGEIPSLAFNLALLKGASVVGVFWGAFVAREPDIAAQNFAEIVGMVETGQIVPPVSRKYPLAGAHEALGQIASRQATGKLILTM